MLDKLNAKLEEVREQKEKTLANLNCLIGAENVILQMINEETNKDKAEEVTENENAAD